MLKILTLESDRYSMRAKVSEKVLALDHLIEQNSILREKSETKKVVYFIWKDPWRC